MCAVPARGRCKPPSQFWGIRFPAFSKPDSSSGFVEKAAYDALESEFESESAPSGNGHAFSSLCSFGSHSLRGAGARATRLLKDWKARR